LQGDMSGALPLLLPLLKNDDANLRTAVVYALNRVGEKAIPHVTDALKDGDRNVRLAALAVLRQQGAAAAKAVPLLNELMKSDPDAVVRRNAIDTMLRLGAEGQKAAVTAATGHPDNFVRRTVLIALNAKN